MQRATKPAKCEICGWPLPRGLTRCPGCIGLPSPAEIRERAAAIRAGWSRHEMAKWTGSPRQPVEIPKFPDPE